MFTETDVTHVGMGQQRIPQCTSTREENAAMEAAYLCTPVVHNSVPIYGVLSCGLQQYSEKKREAKNELWGTPQSQLITVIIIAPLNAFIN